MDDTNTLVIQTAVLALCARIGNLEENQATLLKMIEAQNACIERMVERIC